MRSTVDILIASTLSAVLAVGLYAGTRVEAAYIPVPRGFIGYVNAATCPTGWTEFTNARGVTIVGLQAGGTLNTVVGTALTNLENRAAGIHAHTASSTTPTGSSSAPTVNDPGHYHGIPIVTTTAGSFFGLQGPAGTVYNNVGRTLSGSDIIFTSGQTAGTSPQTLQATGLTVNAPTITVGTPTITVANSAGVSGTNAPYLQLLVCAKS